MIVVVVGNVCVCAVLCVRTQVRALVRVGFSRSYTLAGSAGALTSPSSAGSTAPLSGKLSTRDSISLARERRLECAGCCEVLRVWRVGGKARARTELSA